jgi:hypothetical protein
VDEVQVDVIESEALEAPLCLHNRIGTGRVELGGNEHLLARSTAAAEPLPHAPLVAVGLGCIDMTIPEL